MMSLSCSKMWGLQVKVMLKIKSIATLFSLGEPRAKPRAIPLELHGSSSFHFLSISPFSNCSRHVHMSVGFGMTALPLIDHPSFLYVLVRVGSRLHVVYVRLPYTNLLWKNRDIEM